MITSLRVLMLKIITVLDTYILNFNFDLIPSLSEILV